MKKIFLTCFFVIFLVSCSTIGGDTEILENTETTEETPAPTPFVPVVTPEPPPVYLIYADNAYPPFHMLDTQTGHFVGFEMDLFTAIATDQRFLYDLHNVGYTPALGYLNAGDIDGVMAGIRQVDMYTEKYDFSDGHFTTGQIFAVLQGSPENLDLSGKVVAVEIGTEGADVGEQLAEEQGFELIYFESASEMYEAVITEQAAAAITERYAVEYAVFRDNLPLTTRGELINPVELGFAVRKGEFPELLELYNKGLANLRASGYYNAILARYGLSQ